MFTLLPLIRALMKSFHNGSADSFERKLQGIRQVAQQAETAQVARKLINSLETASDVDLSELRINRRALTADGCYPPYSPVYPPPAYPCYPPVTPPRYR